MTVLGFNTVCQLRLVCNGSQHISLKEHMNLLVNKLTIILHRIVPQNSWGQEVKYRGSPVQLGHTASQVVGWG